MILEFRKVSGKSKGFSLKDVSFAVEKGYLVGVTGKNGAGKSTLLHYIMNADSKYEGEILLNGTNIRNHYDMVRNMVGYVADENAFFKAHTAKENADLLSVFYEKWDEELFLQVMKKMEVPLWEKLENLSRGEFLKFQMAFAMAHDAKLYLIDEATGGMDPIFRKEFFRLLHGILEQEDTSILMVTHIEDEIEMQMDYAAIMEKGQIISFGEVGLNDEPDKRV
ncbi:MAG: ABC transporter ATP-binding protein [Lachnospiraceae bacterium]|nr:ABC transporter ATP-binding protein [Lachnospiraceae bacterium]